MKEKTLKTPSAAIIAGLVPVILKWFGKWVGIDVSDVPQELLDSITVILCTAGGMVFGARWKKLDSILGELD